MAGPISVKLSGVDEGHSVPILPTKKIDLVDINFLLISPSGGAKPLAASKWWRENKMNVEWERDGERGCGPRQ